MAGEVALSTLLLVGTGLLFHTLWNLEQARLGIETQRVTILRDPADRQGFRPWRFRRTRAMRRLPWLRWYTCRLLERMRQVPGVRVRGAGNVAAAVGDGHQFQLRHCGPSQGLKTTIRRRRDSDRRGICAHAWDADIAWAHDRRRGHAGDAICGRDQRDTGEEVLCRIWNRWESRSTWVEKTRG